MFWGGVYHSRYQIPVPGIRKTDAGEIAARAEVESGNLARVGEFPVTLTKQSVAVKMNLPRFTALVPKWRNWQTR